MGEVSASRIVSSYCNVMEMTDKGLCAYSAALPNYIDNIMLVVLGHA